MISIPGKTICSGNLVYDILVRPVDQTPFGTTQWVDTIEPHLGGNGANTSYAMAILGAPVRLLGAVGEDDFAAPVLAALGRVGIDLTCVERSQHPTATSVVLVQTGGARCFLHRPGVSREVFAQPIDFIRHQREGCSHYHLANIFALAHLRRSAPETLAASRAAGLTTSLDTGWDARGDWMAVLGPCLPHLDLLFVNEDEARMLSGSEDPAQAAGFLLSRGVREVIVKVGPLGCHLFFEGRHEHVLAYPVEALDTTGAGDCFAGAFLAGLWHGRGYVESARLANAVGALNVQRLGAVEGLRSYADTLAWMAAR